MLGRSCLTTGQRLPDDFEVDKWNTLRDGLQAIFSGRSAAVSLEVLYRVGPREAGTTHSFQPHRHARTSAAVASRIPSIQSCMPNARHTRSVMRRASWTCTPEDDVCVSSHPNLVLADGLDSVSTADPASPAAFLQALGGIWTEYTERVKMLCNVFLYLDRVFVINRPELLSVREMAMVHFRSKAFGDPSIRPALIGSLLAAIKGDRQDDISRGPGLLASTIGMLSDLKLVEGWLSQALLADTLAFYDAESRSQLSVLSPAAYLRYARQRIDDEARRLASYEVEPGLRAELVQTVRASLVIAHLDTILGSGREGPAVVCRTNLPRLGAICSR